MLSKKDKEWIKEAIAEGVKDALTVEWKIEKVRDDKTGQPLAVEETKTEEVFIPAIFIQLMPYLEGAIRGVQSDVNKNNIKIKDFSDKIEMIGTVLLQTEKSLKCIAAMSDQLKMISHDEGVVVCDGEIINYESTSERRQDT